MNRSAERKISGVTWVNCGQISISFTTRSAMQILFAWWTRFQNKSLAEETITQRDTRTRSDSLVRNDILLPLFCIVLSSILCLRSSRSPIMTYYKAPTGCCRRQTIENPVSTAIYGLYETHPPGVRKLQRKSARYGSVLALVWKATKQDNPSIFSVLFKIL